MDKDAERQKLQDEKSFIEAWRNHAITVAIFTDLQEGQEGLINVICNQPVSDIESFFKHFEAVGHLRGLRRVKSITDLRLEEIKEELKELEDHGN